MLVVMIGIRKSLDCLFTHRELKILDDIMPEMSRRDAVEDLHNLDEGDVSWNFISMSIYMVINERVLINDHIIIFINVATRPTTAISRWTGNRKCETIINHSIKAN